MRWLTATLAGAGVCVAMLGFGAGTASGDSYRVTRTDDPQPDGCKPRDCSLREAVLKANRHRGRDAIVLPPGRYELELGGAEDRARSGDLDIRQRVAVRASGRPRSAIVSGRGVDDGVFDVVRGKTRFDGLAITGGADSVGGISANRRVTVVDSRIARNYRGIQADELVMKRSRVSRNRDDGVLAMNARIENSGMSSNGGKGVLVYSRLELIRSSVAGNADTGIHSGDCATSSPIVGRPLVVRTRVQANSSATRTGGMRVCDGRFTIRRSRFGSNTGAEHGGLHADHFARGVIRRSVFRNNRGQDGAGGAAYLDEVTGTTFHHNFGTTAGAIFGGGGAIERSTFSRNSSAGDGGALNGFGGQIVNSTFASNSAAGDAGAILHTGGRKLRVRSTTIVDNRAGGEGGGLLAERAGRFLAGNVLVARNTVGAGGSDPQCAGTFASLGGNLRSSDDPGCAGFDRASDLVRGQPRIGGLANNGGPTETVKLLKGSPAIGNARPKTSPARDQRGVKRDRRPDVGAFERR